LEEIQAGINFFSGKIVEIVNEGGQQKEVIKEDDVEKEK